MDFKRVQVEGDTNSLAEIINKDQDSAITQYPDGKASGV